MKPPAPSPDLTALQAAVAALTARMTACEANVAALHADDTAVAARLTLDEAAAVDDEARLTTLEASGGVFDPTAIDAEIVALDARVDALEAGGGGDPGTPPDGNVYPLTMQPVATPGDPVTLGVGPDALTLTLACYYNTPPANYNSVAVLLDGKLIAAPLVVSSTSAADNTGRQLFTLHGSWGPAPHTVTLTSGLSGLGVGGLWINEIAYNFVPLVYNGPSVDARGAMPPPNTTTLWDNTGVPVTFSTERVVVAPPPPPVPEPTLTMVHGATLDGAIVPDATLADLLARPVAGDALLLPAEAIVGTSAVPVAMTLAGVSAGHTVIDCTGLTPKYQKAVLVPLVPGITIRDLTITGAAIAAVDGGNAAGVRDNDNGVGFTLVNVEIHRCQNGILTFESDITLHGCNFHDNGAGAAGGGSTHEIYVRGNANTTLTLIDHVSVCGHLSTHALKSRAGHTIVSGSHFTGNGDDGTNGGSVVDICDGGAVAIADSTIAMAVGAGNHDLLAYAAESQRNAAAGRTVMLTRVHVIDTSGNGGKIASGDPAAVLVLDRCTFAGTVAPVVVGWGTVTGSFAPAT